LFGVVYPAERSNDNILEQNQEKPNPRQQKIYRCKIEIPPNPIKGHYFLQDSAKKPNQFKTKMANYSYIFPNKRPLFRE
jgi:hypothetical protein